MGAEITKVYKQELPALRFIGKKYSDDERVDGMFGKHWEDWGKNGWFDLIIKQSDKDMKSLFKDADAAIGLMRHKDGQPFEYWIGLFMPQGTKAPGGFSFRDFPKSTLGVCWLYGTEGEVLMQEDKCRQKLEEAGEKIAKDKEGAFWFFERCVDSRFLTPDKDGKVSLDICWFVE